MKRRSFLAGILGAAAAPAIVRAESLMKIWVPPPNKILATFPYYGGVDVGHHDSFSVWAYDERQCKVIVRTVDWDDVYVPVEIGWPPRGGVLRP